MKLHKFTFLCLILTVLLSPAYPVMAASQVVVIPLSGGQQPTGNATAADVLAGKTFSNANDTDIHGTMVNNGRAIIKPGTTLTPIPEGYHDGTGWVTGDTDLKAENIRIGTSLFGVSGSIEPRWGCIGPIWTAVDCIADCTTSTPGFANCELLCNRRDPQMEASLCWYCDAYPANCDQ